MNNWFTTKVKYTSKQENGTFKRVTEPYLLAAMSFTDAEARIYENLGPIVRGEFNVTAISRTEIHDIFHFEDSDVWYTCKIKFDSSTDGEKSKKVSQTILVSAHSVKNATERLKESLSCMLGDFIITSVAISPLVDIFPYESSPEKEEVTEDENIEIDN
jgi:hypothetical protein